MFLLRLHVFFVPNKHCITIADSLNTVNGNKTAITIEVLPFSQWTDKRILCLTTSQSLLDWLGA